MSQLYPAISPFQHGILEVDKMHKIYWEQSGNPDGVPIVFLHGGPGGATNSMQRRYFNPKEFKIVLFDQRGCGKSIPYAEVKHNTTWDLVQDMEKLRDHLKIKRWVVFGGSWGVTLALCYGIKYPDRCHGFILRGVFLARKEELNWFFDGIGRIFPEAYSNLKNFLPKNEQSELLFHFHRRLMSPDTNVHIPAANAWNRYESDCSTLIPKTSQNLKSNSIALARIEAHYFVNNMFLKDNLILDNIGTLMEKPAIIIQGRYDIICPTKSAFDLANRWPKCNLKIISDAGHSASEPGIQSALVTSIDDMRSLI